MPRSRGWTWQKWYECAMCGFDYPEHRTRYWKGVRRCTDLCQDRTANDDDDVQAMSGTVPVSPGGRNGIDSY